jgi:hypothetical protein
LNTVVQNFGVRVDFNGFSLFVKISCDCYGFVIPGTGRGQKRRIPPRIDKDMCIPSSPLPRPDLSPSGSCRCAWIRGQGGVAPQRPEGRQRLRRTARMQKMPFATSTFSGENSLCDVGSRDFATRFCNPEWETVVKTMILRRRSPGICDGFLRAGFCLFLRTPSALFVAALWRFSSLVLRQGRACGGKPRPYINDMAVAPYI